MKKTLIAASFAVLASGGVSAFAKTFEAWGHTFTYDDFKPVTMDVTVATDKATGHKMNLVKMKNGHMMALVPADRYMASMPSASDDLMQ